VSLSSTEAQARVARVLTLDSRVQAAPNQVSTAIADEAVVLDLSQGVYFGLEGVGGRVWQLLASPRRVDEIVTAVTEEFDVDQATCERDVLSFITELQGAGLVVESADAIDP
jgi:hypothetical protein